MKDSLRDKCDLFADNYRELKRNFKWDYSVNYKLGALLYAMENRRVEPEALKRCREIIKNNTSKFSIFKDTTFFIITVILSLQEEPEKIFRETVNIYTEMKKEGFHTSPYLTLTALSIALQAKESNYRHIISYTKKFYEAMKEKHRFITSSDDYCFAALLAMTDKSVDPAIKEIETSFRELKETFSNSNSVQTLSHILTFGEEDIFVKCRRVVELYRALREKHCKYGTHAELPILGVAALITEDIEKITGEIIEADGHLKTKKGFRGWSISHKERLMYATALVCHEYVTGSKNNTIELSLANSITGILLAQQMAMIAATSSAAASAASASN